MLSPYFEVKATLFFRIHDSVLYGGSGSVGYSSQTFTLLPTADLNAFNDARAEACRIDTANMLGVPVEKVDYITGDEYDRETEDDEGEAGQDE